jgi:pimeloyl-ACP methyl ester carboxylesterase
MRRFSYWLPINLIVAVASVSVIASGRFAQSASSTAAVVRMIPTGKADIEVHVRGRGPAVILLPGTGGDASQFDGLAPVLAAAGFQAIALSVRGAGRSTGPLEGLTLHDYAADAAAVIEALGVASAHVLGRAGGNRVARSLATDRPQLVKTVILVAAGGLVPGDPNAIAAMTSWAQASVPESQRLTAFQSSMLSPATDRARVKPFTTWPAASRSQNAADAATPVNEWWAAGDRVPILVIQGLDDVIAPPGNGRALRDQFGSRVTLVEIPQAGHALLFEQPEKIASAVAAFLKAHP